MLLKYDLPLPTVDEIIVKLKRNKNKKCKKKGFLFELCKILGYQIKVSNNKKKKIYRTSVTS